LPDAVGEDCLETIEVCADDVRVSVDYQTGEPQTNSLAHDSRLAMMHGEAFLMENRCHMG